MHYSRFRKVWLMRDTIQPEFRKFQSTELDEIREMTILKKQVILDKAEISDEIKFGKENQKRYIKVKALIRALGMNA